MMAPLRAANPHRRRLPGAAAVRAHGGDPGRQPRRRRHLRLGWELRCRRACSTPQSPAPVQSQCYLGSRPIRSLTILPTVWRRSLTA